MSNLDRTREALSFIPADDRDIWLKMAMAVKSEHGESGFEVWNQWSIQSASYKADDAKSVWKSVRGRGGVQIGTLFHHAKAYGWLDGGERHKPNTQEQVQQVLMASKPKQADEVQIMQERERAAKNAKAILEASRPAQDNNPYLTYKRVTPSEFLCEIHVDEAVKILGYQPRGRNGLLNGLLLVVPITQTDQLANVEMIDGEGRKAVLAGRGTKSGGYWASSPFSGVPECLLIGEGVATVLSAKQATGFPAIAAFSSGNLMAVATLMRQRYPTAELVILADLLRESGKPDSKALQVAQSLGIKLAIPDFGGDRDFGMTDFNDMAIKCRQEAVKHAILNATVPEKGGGTTCHGDQKTVGGMTWAEPQPLTAKIEAKPYPIHSLPIGIREAVEEVQAFVKAPIALVASAALGALSLACQAHVDVKRAEKLEGPTGLFMLTIADSGERKSTCDGFFTAPIREFEKQRGEVLKEDIQRYEAGMDAWEAKREGLCSTIKRLAKGGKPTDEFETKLADLQKNKPKPPLVPRMLLGDETPENLAWSLARLFPSSGVMSSEAGVVFGAHGMGKDSVMRNLALLNTLWDGGNFSIGRRTSESFSVMGVRLTVALQVQEPALRVFIDRTGELARGTGFLARFLVAWPASTQGQRPYSDPPENWPRLSLFQQRMTEILNLPLRTDEDHSLVPVMLAFSPAAKELWVQYFNSIEEKLNSGGELYDVRDVASKVADNAARLAALFHFFEHGISEIGVDALVAATQIASWHLHESRRFFGELALPSELADAAKLERWLIENCMRERVGSVVKNCARQRGPIRDGKRFKAAIEELNELGRVQTKKMGRRELIYLNPRLLDKR